MNARSHESLAAGGIAEDHRVSRCRSLTGSLWIEVQRHIVDVLLIQELGQVLTTPAIAADDQMLVRTDSLAGDAVNFQAAAKKLRPGQAHDQSIASVDHKRRDEHGDDHAGQDQL